MMDEKGIEMFGEIVNEFLRRNNIRMVLTMPKGTRDVEVQDNTGLGQVIQFFILMNAIGAVVNELRGLEGIDVASEKWAKTVDALLELVRNALLEG